MATLHHNKLYCLVQMTCLGATRQPKSQESKWQSLISSPVLRHHATRLYTLYCQYENFTQAAYNKVRSNLYIWTIYSAAVQKRRRVTRGFVLVQVMTSTWAITSQNSHYSLIPSVTNSNQYLHVEFCKGLLSWSNSCAFSPAPKCYSPSHPSPCKLF